MPHRCQETSARPDPDLPNDAIDIDKFLFTFVRFSPLPCFYSPSKHSIPFIYTHNGILTSSYLLPLPLNPHILPPPSLAPHHHLPPPPPLPRHNTRRATTPPPRQHSAQLPSRNHPRKNRFPLLDRRQLGNSILASRRLHARMHDRARSFCEDERGIR